MKYTRRTPILIYGAGGDGLHLSDTLGESGSEIVGFIDCRASEIEGGIRYPVWSPEDAAAHYPSGVVLVVAIKNVFSHTEVAHALRTLGFTHIIYKPRVTLSGGGSAVELRLAALHDALVRRRQPLEEGEEIPEVPDCSAMEFEDRLHIADDGARVVAWVPAELVFNYAAPVRAFADCNMPLFFPLVDLYRGLLANDRVAENWVEQFLVYSSDWLLKNGFALTDGQRASMLASRASVFQEMQRVFEVDFDFFRRNAPEACMPRPGYFNLTSSGRNRIAYLLARGFRFVPLSICRESYASWLAPERVDSLLRFLGRSVVPPLLAPIPHPLCVSVPTIFTDYTRLFLVRAAARLVREFYSRNMYCAGGLTLYSHERAGTAMKAVRIVSLMRDGGLAAHYFASLGCHSVPLFDRAWQEQAELSFCLGQLFSRSSWSEPTDADILLLDSSADAELAASLIGSAKTVCVLQRGNSSLPAMLTSNFFCETAELFRTIGACGPLVGRVFERGRSL